MSSPSPSTLHSRIVLRRAQTDLDADGFEQWLADQGKTNSRLSLRASLAPVERIHPSLLDTLCRQEGRNGGVIAATSALGEMAEFKGPGGRNIRKHVSVFEGQFIALNIETIRLAA